MEKEKIDNAIKSLKNELSADFVKQIQYEYALDSTGEPAFWIWIVLKDSPKAQSKTTRTLLRKKAEKAIEDLNLGIWCYIRFKDEKNISEGAYQEHINLP